MVSPVKRPPLLLDAGRGAKPADPRVTRHPAPRILRVWPLGHNDDRAARHDQLMGFQFLLKIGAAPLRTTSDPPGATGLRHRHRRGHVLRRTIKPDHDPVAPGRFGWCDVKRKAEQRYRRI